jgi:hypothetical protein
MTAERILGLVAAIMLIVVIGAATAKEFADAADCIHRGGTYDHSLQTCVPPGLPVPSKVSP